MTETRGQKEWVLRLLEEAGRRDLTQREMIKFTGQQKTKISSMVLLMVARGDLVVVGTRRYYGTRPVKVYRRGVPKPRPERYRVDRNRPPPKVSDRERQALGLLLRAFRIGPPPVSRVAQ